MLQRIIFIVLLLFLPSILISQEKINLNFEEAISIAIKNNPQIIALMEQSNIYDKKKDEAFSGFLPQLNANALYKKTTVNTAGQIGLKIPSSMSPTGDSITGRRESMDLYNNYSFGITFNQLIWDSGKTIGQYESAKYLKRSSDEDIKSNAESLVINLYQAVLNYTLNKKLLEAAQSYETNMENHLEMAKAQVASGIRTNLDILRAESDLYNARLNTLRIQNNIKLIKINIKNLLGIANESDIEISPPEKEEYLIFDIKDNYEYIQKRSEYLSYKNKIESLKSLLKSARSQYLPNLYLTGGLNYTGYEIDNLVYNWSVGATLNWNLFSGFYTLANEEEIKAQMRLYESNLNQIVKNMYYEIENTKILYQEAKERLELNKLLTQTALESLTLSEARYKSGLGTFIEVSDVQNVYMNAKNSYLQAEYDLILSAIRLKRALGLLLINK